MDHAVHVRGRLSGAAHLVRSVTGRSWGTKPRVLRELYRRAIGPALLYGAEVWGERWSDTRIRRHLAAAQRPFLLGISRAYRTTSNVAIQVLSGCMPLHLEAKARFMACNVLFAGGSEGAAIPGMEPHPAEKRTGWTELREEDTSRGSWVYTDASRSGDETGVGIVVRPEAGRPAVQGIRLQAGYPVHAAELYAVSAALRIVARRTPEATTALNLVTDSKVALDMIRERRGRAAQEIDRHLRTLERAGKPVRLWWNDGSCGGLREADRRARRAREEEDTPREEGWTTRRMASQASRREVLLLWQQEWIGGDKGRLTFSLCPQVEERLRGWSPKAIHLLTGHGLSEAISGISA